MSKTMNKFSPEVRQRAIRMVLDHERDLSLAPFLVRPLSERPGQSGARLINAMALIKTGG